MTEYDLSPDAYERYLDTQEKIGQWIDRTREHSPCNPFTLLPSEAEEFERTRTPQPAFRVTPRGDISPTYSNYSRRHEQSQWNSPSQRSSISSANLMMPQPRKRERPKIERSVTSPPPPSQPFAGQQFLPQVSNYHSYPTPPSRIPSPYSSRHSSQHQPLPMPLRSSSQNSFRSVHSPHIHASPIIPANTYPYFSPSHQPMHHQQHVVVVRGDRDFTVVPPLGHHIQFLVRFF